PLRLDDARRPVGRARLGRLLCHGPGRRQRGAPRAQVRRRAAGLAGRRAANTPVAEWRMARLNVRRIAGALGAEIGGVDLRELDDETVAAIRAAWLEHLVVFFRDQPLPQAQYMAFAQRIGRPIEYPFVKGIAGFPEIIEVKKLEHERVNFGGVWHSDTAYLEEPPMASMLLAREVPPHGGDTLFANMYMAYEM